MAIKNLIKKLNIFKSPELPEVKFETVQHPATAAVHRAIADRKKEDPLIGVKIGAKEINHRIILALGKTDPKGAHVGSLLTILGSLAGYSCQMVARINLGELAKENKVTDVDLVHVAETADGKNSTLGIALINHWQKTNIQYGAWQQAQHNITGVKNYLTYMKFLSMLLVR